MHVRMCVWTLPHGENPVAGPWLYAAVVTTGVATLGVQLIHLGHESVEGRGPGFWETEHDDLWKRSIACDIDIDVRDCRLCRHCAFHHTRTPPAYTNHTVQCREYS